jgi:drug/metabolite transporter (DMT)-like permease
MNATEWGLLLALAAVWSTPFLFNRIALDDLPPLTVVLGRVGLAAVALNGALLLTGRRMPRSSSAWMAFATMGLLNNVVPFALIVWGQTRITSGLASILNATTPLCTILVAHALTREERLTPRRLAGVVVGFGGVVVVLGPVALEGLGGPVAAQLAVVGAAVSYAFAGVYGRRFRELPPLIPATGQVTASALLLLPLAVVVDRPWALAAPGGAALGAIAGLALLCTAVGYVLYFRILATAGATNLLLVTFLLPIGALLLGAILLDERLVPRQLGGMALIFVGLAIVDGRVLLASRLAPHSAPSTGRW